MVRSNLKERKIKKMFSYFKTKKLKIHVLDLGFISIRWYWPNITIVFNNLVLRLKFYRY